MIEVREASKRYGTKRAVDRVSVSIRKETITSLIGPNGAGKSTLLSMMSRLIPMDAGEIYVDGREVGCWKTDELAKQLSILKQSNHLSLRLTVEELVGFGRFPYSQGRLSESDLEHVERAIRYMSLEGMRGRYLDELSGGERQRAFIAMVVAQDADYILLDEPLNNLDMRHSVQIMKILRRLVDELGKTVVLVMHDVNFASCYSDDIVAMKDGKLIREGPAGEVIDPSVLKTVYDMDIQVEEVGRRKICLYFW